MSRNQLPFWKTKTLAEMTPEEWESLCDGCGQCCLHKFQDVDTGEIVQTDVACRLLDLETVRCMNYRKRHKRVPSCVVLTPARAAELKWLPATCAYRLVAEGKDLEEWHPLVSGSPETVHSAGISIRRKAVSERDVDMNQLEEHAVQELRARSAEDPFEEDGNFLDGGDI